MSGNNQTEFQKQQEKDATVWKPFQQKKFGVSDMSQMGDALHGKGASSMKESDKSALHALSGDEVTENLKIRYRNGLQYTGIGQNILISLNPHNFEARLKEREKESKKAAKKQSNNQQVSDTLRLDDDEFVLLLEEERQMMVKDPRSNVVVQDQSCAHGFSMAARCYLHMHRERENQIVILKGNSGSGKTTQSHWFIEQLDCISQRFPVAVYGGDVSHTQDSTVDYGKFCKRLQAGILLLEQFTQARTHFSANSSRCHNFIEIQFNKSGFIVGGKLVNFMLEKQRVVQAHSFAQGELNFHVFYGLLEGMTNLSKADRDRLCLLDSISSYDYMSKSGSRYFSDFLSKVDGSIGQPSYGNLPKLLSLCGFGAKLQDEMFKLISCVMLLGNLSFGENRAKKAEGVFVSSEEILIKCAQLLGISSQSLETCLVQRTATIGTTSCASFLNLDQCRLSRDSLVIKLYTMLVQFVSNFVNGRLDASSTNDSDDSVIENWIGILDFAGFEDHNVVPGRNGINGTGNRFWQFAANFSNETVSQWIQQQVYQLCNEAKHDTEPSAENPGILQAQQSALTAKLSVGQFLCGGSGSLCGVLDSTTVVCGENDDSTLLGSDISQNFQQSVLLKDKRTAKVVQEDDKDYGSLERNVVDSSSLFVQMKKRNIFGIKHYGGHFSSPLGAASQSTNSIVDGGMKVVYDSSDFVFMNKFVDRSDSFDNLMIDFQRIVVGSADYAQSSNSLLVTMFLQSKQAEDQQQQLSTSAAPEEVCEAKIDQVSITQKNLDNPVLDLVKRGSSISRVTSLRKVQDENKRLSAALRYSPEKKDVVYSAGDSDDNVNKRNLTTTAVSELTQNLKCMSSLLQSEVSSFWWIIYCVNPNNQSLSKKFNDQLVLQQVRRLDIPLLLASGVGTYSKKIGYTDFRQRYGLLLKRSDALQKLEAIKKADSSSKSNLEMQKSQLQLQCRALVECHAIITGGGGGKVAYGAKYLYLNERSWFALEKAMIMAELDDNDVFDKLNTQFVEECEYFSKLHDPNDASVDVSTQSQDYELLALEKSKFIAQQKKVKLSSQRKLWLFITTLLTWWIPTFMIRLVGRMKTPAVIQAWREKVAINVLILFVSGMMLFIILGYATFLCPKQNVYSLGDMGYELSKGTNMMAVHGRVYDVTNFPHGNARSYLFQFAGTDVSKYLTYQNSGCQAYRSAMAASTLQKRSLDNSTGPSISKCPNDPTQCHINGNDVDSILPRLLRNEIQGIEYKGQFVMSPQQVAVHNSQQDCYIVINDQVFDVTFGMGGLFSSDDTTKFLVAAGRVNVLQPDSLDPNLLQCIADRYYIGSLDGRQNLQCSVASYTLLSLTAVLSAVMLAKFLAALQLSAYRIPEDIERHCIIQIPCYTENEESLKKTIDSASMTDYSDEHKLLFIVADGFVKGSGNNQMTAEILLDILGVPNAAELLHNDTLSPRYEYLALGDGAGRLNKAKVFCGYYTVQTHRVPYLVIAKCGKESETKKPGNRGKRDSQLILMKFLNKVFLGRAMLPLEAEMYRQLQSVLNRDPSIYEYCLMVDADTEVQTDSLKRLIASMLHDSLIMGVCGETTIENQMDSWVSMIQVYEYYISHHLSKAFESLFGSVTCLPGCFSMYRIKSPGRKSIPLIIDDRIISDYEENMVDTLHKKNLFTLGEDRYLTTLMLKHFPSFKNKFTPDAACKTIVPKEYWVLLSQRRRWINSTVHNLWELLLVPQLCGCLCFSMRTVVALDLFATLTMPASIAYLVGLIFLTIRDGQVTIIAQSLYLFAAVYGSQAIIFLLKRKWEMIGWMIIYVLSLPVYGFILPIYSFWNMDDFSWGNTRKVSGDNSRLGHGAGVDGVEDDFDEGSVKTTPFEQLLKNKKNKTSGGLEGFDAVAKSSTINGGMQSYYGNSMAVPQGVYMGPMMDGGADIAQYGYGGSVVGYPQYGSVYDGVSYAGRMSYQIPPYHYMQPQTGRPLSAMPASADLGNGLYQSQPQSARLQSNIGSPHLPPPPPQLRVNTEFIVSRVPRQNGLLVSLQPIAASISQPLARWIFAEIEQLLKSEDLKQLTKKNVRDKVAKIVNEKLKSINDGQQVEELDGFNAQDMLEVAKEYKNSSINFDRVDIKQFVGRCVEELLIDLARANQGEQRQQ
ncbi:hypothetical protein MP228_007262 [Amoeboaphelidium protococcarum]|nr:hypothetical protein MP228_007262 [Amoeboaphelidium protococcarum]